MSIVEQTKRFVTTRILPSVKSKHQKLFAFGIQALSLTAYDSLASNARLVVGNVSTAASKIYRLASNTTMVDNFHRLIVKNRLVTKKSMVNIDFSTFCGFQTLAFGVQTKKGRALPVWLNCITYPIRQVGSQNIFVLEEIKKFGALLGFYPAFVFDRGFWIPCVMKFLLQNNISFYLRIKQGQRLQWNARGRRRVRANCIGTHTKDTIIVLFGHRLRLIVSPPPPKKTHALRKQNRERWYIITNDTDSSREDILSVYRTRFEIEETFKDYKHVQRLKVLRIKKKETFIILLWFATLAFWLAWWSQKAKRVRKHPRIHPKKKRSFFRIFWEEFQYSLRSEQLCLVTDQVAPG